MFAVDTNILVYAHFELYPRGSYPKTRDYELDVRLSMGRGRDL